jgi:hypothetical protein
MTYQEAVIMKKEYIINRQGKDFVLYEGLLDEAHQQGLHRISTTIIQIPHEDNGMMAIVAAEVETSKGTFTGIGDASPANVSRMIVPHILRMAETRSKARALRDAVNIGVTALDEMGDLDDLIEDTNSDHNGRVRSARENGEIYHAGIRKASPNKPASANQLATIAKLARLLGEPEEVHQNLTSAEASDQITELSREYNERKGSIQRSA